MGTPCRNVDLALLSWPVAVAVPFVVMQCQFHLVIDPAFPHCLPFAFRSPGLRSTRFAASFALLSFSVAVSAPFGVQYQCHSPPDPSIFAPLFVLSVQLSQAIRPPYSSFAGKVLRSHRRRQYGIKHNETALRRPEYSLYAN